MIRRRRLAAALTLLLLTSACAGGGKSEDPPASVSSPPDEQTTGEDPCAGVELEETEVGVTDDKIVIQVIADVGASDVSDRSRRALEAVEAWADDVNERGGLACRKVEVQDWDSRMSPAATAEGVLDACENAVALIGTSALLMLDTDVITTCPDEGLAAIGLPDLAERAVEVPHQCAALTFAVVGTSGSCPYLGGARRYLEMVGPFQYLRTIDPVSRGTFVVPGESPAATDAAMATIRAAQAAGLVKSDGEVAGAQHERSEAAAAAYDIADPARSSFVYNDAHPDVLSELQKRAADDTTTPLDRWVCSSACYTKAFRDRDEADGTYVWLPHLPFEEAESIPALAAYLDAVGGIDNATTTGLAAWTAATTFESVVGQIVERDGYNGVTRARILEALAAQRDAAATTAGSTAAVFGPGYQLGRTPGCFVMMRVADGKFFRVHPAAPGTLDCDPDNLVTVDLGPSQLRPA
jgi:hypothetical protein